MEELQDHPDHGDHRTGEVFQVVAASTKPLPETASWFFWVWLCLLGFGSEHFEMSRQRLEVLPFLFVPQRCRLLVELRKEVRQFLPWTLLILLMQFVSVWPTWP